MNNDEMQAKLKKLSNHLTEKFREAEIDGTYGIWHRFGSTALAAFIEVSLTLQKEAKSVAQSPAGTETSANNTVATRSVRPASDYFDFEFGAALEITSLLKDVSNQERANVLREVCEYFGIEAETLAGY